MSNQKNSMENKVKKYIDNVFSQVEPSQQLFDLKEELSTNLKEKIADYKMRGMTDEQAFKEAVVSLGDLSGLVDDMRQIGWDKAKQGVYSTMTARISTAGIIGGVLLTLFGIFTSLMTYFMDLPGESVVGTGIFIVAGGAIITYSILTRETRRKYAMNRIRAAFYALSVGIILFAIFTAIMSKVTTGEMFIAIGSGMVFSLVGVGLFLFLILTGTDRRK
ncbi:MAG: permease prefix domain 1-containing protein [Bacillota bacterium]|jgi:hypothetical protein|nr:hypothetical protein [Clostridia bacterium]